ncbi:Protein CBG03512 [Caenorhabditis briggsae]|uniref:Protein CBG03512 n=1 Tax=Caenorhabditis briggsae TaxID=6238 RepID=A8WV87_CAEBR|nr:Protein CBG03512 [Caenorhabditis briggsae]CAP24398.2 Protein CBG03512 [Caenorhabditis briggsae]
MLSNISDAEALDAAKSWEIELFYFGLSSIQFNKATLTKTATQMAWADTEFIGVVRRSVKALVGRGKHFEFERLSTRKGLLFLPFWIQVRG